MNTYYTEDGKVVGHAWSTAISCDSKQDHAPHSHYPAHAIYGPYMCAGWPRQTLYDTPARKPVTD